jgi:hypothetical protein
MITIEEIIKWSKPHPMAKYLGIGGGKGRMSRFGNKKIEHFGIVLSNKNILHVHGYARIDEYDYLGIKNFEKTDEYLFSKIYKIIRIL